MIIVDTHEPDLIRDLLRWLGAEISVKHITPGDYVVGDMGVERKSLNDFFASIVRKRLFDQIARLKEAYQKRLLIVEGDISHVKQFGNPRVFWGAYLSIVLDLETPIIFTPDMEETANLLFTLDKRISEDRRRFPVIRYKPRVLSDDEWKIFVVQGLPYVGYKTAERLLTRFRTVRRIFNATPLELMRIPEIGEKKARRIVEIITSEYGGQATLP